MHTCQLLCVLALLFTFSPLGSAQEQEIWVSSTSTPSSPCGSVDNPCGTISDAVLVACNVTDNLLNQNVTIVVEQGNYTIDSTIHIPCSVQLRSLSGENTTILTISDDANPAIEFIHSNAGLSALSGFSIHAKGNFTYLVRFNLGEDSDVEISNITFSRSYRVDNALHVNQSRSVVATNLNFHDSHAGQAISLSSVSMIEISGLTVIDGEYSTILQIQEYDQLSVEQVTWHYVLVSKALLSAEGHLKGMNRSANYLSDFDILEPLTDTVVLEESMITLHGPEDTYVRNVRVVMAGIDRDSRHPYTWKSVFDAERRLTLENVELVDVRVGAIVSGCFRDYTLGLCDLDHHLIVRNSTFVGIYCYALFLPGAQLELDSCTFENITANFVLTGMGTTTITANNVTATNLEIYAFVFIPQSDSSQVNLTDVSIYNVTRPQLLEGSLFYYRCDNYLHCSFYANRLVVDTIEATLLNTWSSMVVITDSTFDNLQPPVGGGMVLKTCNSTIERVYFHGAKVSECITINGGDSWISDLLFEQNNASIALITTSAANVTLENVNMTRNKVDGVVGSLIWAQKGTIMTARQLNITDNVSVLGGGCAFTLDAQVYLSSATFRNNHAAFGGALYMSGESNSTVEDVEIHNCTASSDGGGVWIGDNAQVTLRRIVISDTKAISSGGTIVIWANATLTVSHALLTNGEALSGGGVYLGGYSVSSFDYVNVTYCQAFTSGGGLANTAKASTTWSNFLMHRCNASVGSAVVSEDFSNVTMSQGTICHNHAENEAGGLLLDFNSQAFLTSVEFYNNSAGSTAGAVMAALNSVADVQNCSFSDNFSGSKGGSLGVINSANVHMVNVVIQNGGSDSGGAIYVDDSGSLNMENTTIFNNTASSRAGGLHCAGRANITLTDCLVSNNVATEGPGGAFVIQDSAYLMLLGGHFMSNNATYGGAFFSQSSGRALQTSNSHFFQNFARYDGGALYFSQGSNSQMQNVTCEGNYAAYDGGCLAVVDETSLEVAQSTITQNTAEGRGGGIVMGQNSTFVMTDCTVSANRGVNGGGLFVVTQNGNLTDKRSIFRENRATYGAAAFVGGSKVSFIGTTFEFNNSTAYGGAVNLKLDTSTPSCPSFTNNLFKNNSAALGGAISVIPLFTYVSKDTSDCAEHVFINATIEGNHATFYGGGLFLVVKKNIKLFQGVSFLSNYADRFGGAVFFDQYFNASDLITEGNFSSNIGYFGGDNAGYGDLTLPQNAPNFCQACTWNQTLLGTGYQTLQGAASFPAMIWVDCPTSIDPNQLELIFNLTIKDDFGTAVKGPFLDHYNNTFVNMTATGPSMVPGFQFTQLIFNHSTGNATVNLSPLCLQPQTYQLEFTLVSSHTHLPPYTCNIQVPACNSTMNAVYSSEGCLSCDPISSAFPFEATLVLAVVVLLCILFGILAALAAGYVRRKRKLAHYAALEIPDFTSKPHPKLEDILNDSTITRLRWQDVTLGRVIGKGSSGIVREGVWRHSGEELSVALKELILTVEDLSQDDFRNFLVEIKYASALVNKYIVRFLGILVTPDLARIYLVTELMQQGSLRDLLTKKGPNLPLYVRVKMAKEAAKGMTFLHSKNLIHRDLKSHNLLVNENWVCKVGDFGISTVRPTVTRAMTCVGTPVYMAPEVLSRNKYSEKADVYSFGIVLTEIFTDRLPYDHAPYNEMNQAQLMYNILENNSRPMLTNIDPTMQQLIEECWKADPQLRPTFAEIVGRLKRFETEVLPDGELPPLPSPTADPYLSSPFSSSEVLVFSGDSEIELPSPPRHLTDEDPHIN